MEYQELIERLRCEGDDVARDEAADAIESLLAENGRLAHNIAVTEQTMREYQELAAQRLEEIAKYRDAPVVAWVEVVDSYEGPYHFNGEKLLNVGKHKLIVKPGEEK